MQAPPPSLQKIADPPGDSFAYYYRPPLAEGQRGVWDLQANAAPTWGRRPRKPMIRSEKVFDGTESIIGPIEKMNTLSKDKVRIF